MDDYLELKKSVIDESDYCITHYAPGLFVPFRREGLEHAKSRGKLCFALVEEGTELPPEDFELLDAYWSFDGPVYSRSYFTELRRMLRALESEESMIKTVTKYSLGEGGPEADDDSFEIDLGKIDN